MSKKTFNAITSVTTKYDKHGNFKERVVSAEVPLTSRTSERAKKQKVLDMLTDKVAKLEIGPWFANGIAKIIKAEKRIYKKPKQYIEFGNALALFKASIETYKNEINLIKHMIANPDEHCLNEDALAKLKKEYNEHVWLFGIRYPREALELNLFCRIVLQSEMNMKNWFSAYINNHHPSGIKESSSLDDIKKFLIEKIKEVQGI